MKLKMTTIDAIVDTRARVADNLKRCIVRANVSNNWLAQASGVSRSNLYKILSLKSSPTIDTLTRLALLLEVDPKEFLK